MEELEQELAEERRKARGLARQLSELTAATTIRAELQKLGIAKVELAYRAVKDDLQKSSADEVREYLAKFAAENPELMPARMTGGSGAVAASKGVSGGGIDLEKIRPGMSAEDMDKVRAEIARVASQTLRGGW
ncbi:MAG: hypothetical protein WDO18_21080 [Acidobacteriota bacterium]